MIFDVNPKDISVAEYLKFFGKRPGGIVLRWQFAGDYGERLSILEEALDRCYSRLVDTRGLNEDRSEDELSMQIANMLSASGISARHDRHINGHCDIVVDAEDGFMWLGEAKSTAIIIGSQMDSFSCLPVMGPRWMAGIMANSLSTTGPEIL